MTAPDYNGVEDLRLFRGPQSLEAYRQMLLKKTAHQVRFISKHVVKRFGRSIDILEIGSGNGRLLIGMAGCGMRSGFGIDTSESRLAFADRWAHDVGVSNKIYFDQQDVLALQSLRPMDLVVCITGCLNYFNGDAMLHVLELCKTSGGMGLFELYKPPIKNNFWQELPPEDPFQYYLHEYKHTRAAYNCRWGALSVLAMCHNKVFIGRDGTIDKRSEILHYYSVSEFMGFCLSAGYKKFHWAEGDKEKFVVLVE